MPNVTLSARVSAVRAYLASPEGRAANRVQLLALGYSYERRLGLAVVAACGSMTEEELERIVDEIMLAELGTVAA